MNRHWIGPRYASLFSWGRPPLPWDLADLIHGELAAHQVSSVGVTGSICPSVLTAFGYDAPEREINIFANHSRRDDGMGRRCMPCSTLDMAGEVAHVVFRKPLGVRAEFFRRAVLTGRLDLVFSNGVPRLLE